MKIPLDKRIRAANVSSSDHRGVPAIGTPLFAYQKRGDANIATKFNRPAKAKPEVTWEVGKPNPKQKQAFLAKTLYVGYGGAKGGG